MPAWAVMSVNSIGPEGRGGVGLGEGDTAATGSAEGAVGATDGDCLHAPDNATNTKRAILSAKPLRPLRLCGEPLRKTFVTAEAQRTQRFRRDGVCKIRR